LVATVGAAPTTKLQNNLNVTGNLTVDGTSTVTGTQTFTGDVAIGDDLTVTDDVAITGDLAVTGNTTLTGTSLHTGVATFTLAPVLSTATFTASGDTYTIPDVGNASFVMTAGAQTIAGATTFTLAPVLTSATISANGDTITIQDLGNANLVQSEGAQTVNGVKTFGSIPVVPAGSFPRTALATDAAAEFPIDLQTALRTDTGLVLDATGGAGLFAITNGTHSAPGLKLVGETANTNTKTDYASLMFVLPENYVDGAAVTVKVTVDQEGAGTFGTNTIDVEAYELDDAGAVGADICATAVANLAASPTERSFTITPTGLVHGDKLLIYFTMVVQETGGTNSNGAINDITVACDIKG
jgi:hypothetical protein